ncbi:MAG TPA: hypothetical protein VJQ47_17455 [Steroidobacteraceae bacterium]|nr:hypothetical protein [Steroidobacteraceae bacterium]
MSANSDSPSAFEQQARRVLEESVTRVDGRVRSRLNQARHAAVAHAEHRPWAWTRLIAMPAAGAVATAVVIALVWWPHAPQGELPVMEGGHSTVEDMDLLADGEAMDLVEGSEGASFYEWAAGQQADAAGQPDASVGTST